HWFWPDVRVGKRQRTCGPGCRRRRHERIDRRWRERHADYDRARRLGEKVARSEQRGGADRVVRPPPLEKVPWDVLQDAMGIKATVIIADLARLLASHAQDAMHPQVLESTVKSAGLPP